MESILSIISEVTPIHTTETGEQVVYGRELHKGLEINQDYESWIKEMIDWTDSEEGKSYSSVLTKSSENRSIDDRPKQDHILSLEMAQEIGAFQPTPFGKKIRRTLISVTKPKSNLEKNSKENLRDLVDNHLDDLLKEV